MIDATQEFLQANGWGKARAAPLAGDASARSYFRLQMPDGASAVLMSCPSATGAEIGRFARIAGALSDLGLSAPRVLAVDREQGLALLEDLGDNLIRTHLERWPDDESSLYSEAIRAIGSIQAVDPGVPLPHPDTRDLAEATEPAFSWYAADRLGTPDDAFSAFSACLETYLSAVDVGEHVPAHRDYHSENLFWLGDRQALSRLGIIDFQDMMHAHPIYDLVSLLTDARRQIGRGLARDMIGLYCSEMSMDRRAAESAFAVYAVQRNTRILGVFSRLAICDHKLGYLGYLPRVWGYLEDALSHPDLSSLRQIFVDALPPPLDDHLEHLRSKC